MRKFLLPLLTATALLSGVCVSSAQVALKDKDAYTAEQCKAAGLKLGTLGEFVMGLRYSGYTVVLLKDALVTRIASGLAQIEGTNGKKDKPFPGSAYGILVPGGQTPAGVDVVAFFFSDKHGCLLGGMGPYDFNKIKELDNQIRSEGSA